MTSHLGSVKISESHRTIQKDGSSTLVYQKVNYDGREIELKLKYNSLNVDSKRIDQDLDKALRKTAVLAQFYKLGTRSDKIKVTKEHEVLVRADEREEKELKGKLTPRDSTYTFTPAEKSPLLPKKLNKINDLFTQAVDLKIERAVVKEREKLLEKALAAEIVKPPEKTVVAEKEKPTEKPASPPLAKTPEKAKEQPQTQRVAEQKAQSATLALAAHRAVTAKNAPSQKTAESNTPEIVSPMPEPVLASFTLVAMDDPVEQFWKDFSTSRDLQNQLETMQLDKILEPEMIAQLLVNEYDNVSQLEDAAKAKLVKAVLDYITPQKPETATVDPYAPFELSKGLIVKRCLTIGDGSCGIHALMGQKNDFDMYECKDVIDVRHRFVEHLRKLAKDDNLPSSISSMLEDFYWAFDEQETKRLEGSYRLTEDPLPEVFTKAFKPAYDRIKKLKPANPEEVFRKAPEVLEAYFKRLESINRDLDQTELFELAKFLQRPMVLVQYEHGRSLGNERAILMGEGFEPVASTGKKTYVWYSDGHYEALEVLLSPG